MSGDAFFRSFGMLLPFGLIWMFSSAIVHCQECSTTGLDVYGGYRYVFNDSGGTFNETRAHCQNLGGDMVIITSQQQNNFIAGRLPRENGNYYIGLEDMDNDDEYRWIDGTIPGYSNWVHTLALGYDRPYCGVMRSNYNDQIHGKWNRVTCTSQQRLICQIPVDVPVLSSAPEDYESGPNHFVIRWSQWNCTTDVGEGSATAYKVYVYSGNGSVVHSATVDPASGCATMACDVLQYNVTGLEPLMRYSVRISVIPEGFEGDEGPALTIMTDEVVTPTPADVSYRSGTTDVLTTEFHFSRSVLDEYMMAQCPTCPSVSLTSWILFGISMMGNVVLAILLCLCFQKRRAPSALKSEPSKIKDDPSPHYENPAFDSSKNPDAHTYQDLIGKEDNYEELQDRQRDHGDYVNISDP